jgi:hypothetical protein
MRYILCEALEEVATPKEIESIEAELAKVQPWNHMKYVDR